MKVQKRFLILLGAVAYCLPSCETVQPYERAFLSEYIMLPSRDPVAKSLNEHLYFSREAAFGGEGVGGGGCGCN